MPVLRVLAGLLLLLPPANAFAQTWNSPQVRELVARAIARRATMQADSGLRAFRARAHGFVFFLGQLGEGFPDAPRLVKSDQLELEVYWRAPGLSKQIIVGRRDRRDLPTDIQYHRDHLGIVQNNFGDSIRLGEGDEVRDVPHPLSPDGPSLYDFALTDSLGIQLPDRLVRVYQVLVRPREFAAPRIAGSLYLDVEQAQPVRFQFSFTPAAYLDRTVEDITVELDNGLWFGRYWLPRRQEIEIRRRTSWLDLPARGIIRGRWEIGAYEFNPVLPPNLFPPGAPEIVSLPPTVRDTFRWSAPLDAEIRRVIGPVEAADLVTVRAEIERAVEHRAMAGLAPSAPSFGSLSDVVRVNRVQGLTPGFGWRVRPGRGAVTLGAWSAFGTADHRLVARLSVSRLVGAWMVTARAAREIRDVGDVPVISGAANSIRAQERGDDHGDYLLMHAATVRVVRALGVGTELEVEGGAERSFGVGVAARPAAGQYRPNPALGGPARGVMRLSVRHRAPSFRARAFRGRVDGEAGVGGGERYVRVALNGTGSASVGRHAVRLDAQAGWGSSALPRDRSFVLGGLGTLPGEPFRAWGGRRLVLVRLTWESPIPFPAIPIGGYGSTGRQAVLSPFVAFGWAGTPPAGVPWVAAPDVRGSGGIALELFHRLLRVEAGSSLRRWGVEWSVDLRRDFWSIL